MTLRVAIVGSGPAGFAVAAALLNSDEPDVEVNLIERAELPDGLLRHGPAAGVPRLKDVARQVDRVLKDARVTFFGGVDVGAGLPLDRLRIAADAVVLATGAPHDLPLGIAGSDSVGVGTISHVEAWLAGNADVDVAELDLAMDTAVLIGACVEAIRAADVLCGNMPAGLPAMVTDRLAHSKLRHVQLVDPRPLSELAALQRLPDELVVRDELTPVGVVGRNRARAVRCVHRPDPHGRVVTEDLRAQLLLRPRTDAFVWPGLDEAGGHIAGDGARVLVGGIPATGLYVAGWAGRSPSDDGSHHSDAAAVVAAIQSDRQSLTPPCTSLSDVLAANGIEASQLRGWSAVAATDLLLNRFAGEGASPLADYDALVEQVDED